MGEAGRIHGETIPAPQDNDRLAAIRQPVGVTAAITPRSFSAAMIARKAAPALAAGCTMIVRPADLTHSTALALAALAERVDVPCGVVQAITGNSREIGAMLDA